MPTPRLTGRHKQEILDAAPGAVYKKDIAANLGINNRTLLSRIHSLRITDAELKAAMAGKIHQTVGEIQPEQHSGRTEPSLEIVGATSAVEPDIDEIRRETERRYALKAARAEQKRHQKIRFPHGPIAIFFLGDQHIGNAGTDVDRMFREQEMILATPSSYVWQMGDVVDQFILGRLIAENWKPSLPVQEQWWLAEHYIAAFKDRLVALNAGNHDAWAQKASGVDRMRDITPSGVLYDSDTIRATVEVGNRRFKVWTRHKWRGKSMYNMTHGQERGARFDEPNHDVYVGAHNHTGSVARELIHAGSRKVAIQTGSYKVHDDFAQQEGFAGHDASTACGLVLHDSGTFFATSNIQAVLEYMTAVYRG